MRLTAEIKPWSSVVGTGVLLMDESGKCIAQLSLLNVSHPGDFASHKALALEISQTVADAINRPQNGPVGVNMED